MINLGRFRANLPNIYIRPTLPDWILSGISVGIALAVWILLGLHYTALSAKGNDTLIFAIIATVATILQLLVPYIPVRWVNFPFRITEQNVWRQYFLAQRLVRAITVEINIIFLSLFLSILISWWTVYNDPVQLIMLCIMAATVIIYMIIAYRWR
jgi:hypothetical protein